MDPAVSKWNAIVNQLLIILDYLCCCGRNVDRLQGKSVTKVEEIGKVSKV